MERSRVFHLFDTLPLIPFHVFHWARNTVCRLQFPDAARLWCCSDGEWLVTCFTCSCRQIIYDQMTRVGQTRQNTFCRVFLRYMWQGCFIYIPAWERNEMYVSSVKWYSGSEKAHVPSSYPSISLLFFCTTSLEVLRVSLNSLLSSLTFNLHVYTIHKYNPPRDK